MCKPIWITHLLESQKSVLARTRYVCEVKAHTSLSPVGACVRVWCARIRVCMCAWVSCCLTSLDLCGEHGVFPHEKCSHLQCYGTTFSGHLLSGAHRPVHTLCSLWLFPPGCPLVSRWPVSRASQCFERTLACHIASPHTVVYNRVKSC